MIALDANSSVDLGVVPYFMDMTMIAKTMTLNECSRKEAVERLTRLWMSEKNDG